MGGARKDGQKNFKILIFSKVLKLFTHGMGCFGTGLAMLFHPYKGLLVTYELFAKIEKKTAWKLLFSSPSSVRGPPQAKNSTFSTVFSYFLKEFVCDEQTFIEVKQHPQAGPETTHIMCVKYENFLKNHFFDFFWPIFMGGPTPHGLITAGMRESMKGCLLYTSDAADE